MPGTVKLNVVEGPMKGREFVFEEHDTFLVGRQDDCHAQLLDDGQVSRHHFILEANPPDARLRDLGSLNGTYVNGNKIGGRESGESPEDGARRRHAEINLADNDLIQVGETALRVRIDVPRYCCRCGAGIQASELSASDRSAGAELCPACRERDAGGAEEPLAAAPVRCQKCGKDVSSEVGALRRGDYICLDCRRQARANPIELLLQMIRQAGQQGKDGKALKIEGFDIGRSLGEGGFGAVYLARRQRDNREVALKVMLSRVAVDPNSRKLFLREIESMKELRHENIVPLLEHGSAGSVFYFVMEYCPGGSVGDLMARRGGRLSVEEAGPIMIGALNGLAEAHRRDLVHRDLKPQNILLDGPEENRVARLCDFGLAKNFQLAGFSGMTMDGSMAGTPPFMPREQVTEFRFVKPVSDVWSIGATFYNMLTGQFPRDIAGKRDPVAMILDSEVIPIRKRNPDVPRSVAKVVDRALSEKIKSRYHDASVMLDALSHAL